MRVAISKKLRFEVFKRDLFTCKYCGSKAPDVVLEVDHVVPVASGGKNNTLNLVTSCFDCNRGKGKRELSDTSVMDKQRKQLEDIAEKREQMKMMLNWRKELSNLEKEQIDEIEDIFRRNFEYFTLSDYGRKETLKLIRKFGLIEVMDATELSISKYNRGNDEEVVRSKNCFLKIGALLGFSKMSDDDKKISYIVGICKNKFRVDSPWALKDLIKKYSENYDLDDLKKRIINNEFNHLTHLKSFLL